MSFHNCQMLEALLTKSGGTRRWEVLVAYPDGTCADEGLAVRGVDEDAAAVEALRQLRRRTQPLREMMGCAMPPSYVFCLVEASGPLVWGSGCMFRSHFYIGTTESPQPTLLECGIAHMKEDGGIVFYDYAEYTLMAAPAEEAV